MAVLQWKREFCHSLHLVELALRLGVMSASSLAQGTGLATVNTISRAIKAMSGPLQRGPPRQSQGLLGQPCGPSLQEPKSGGSE